MVRNREEEEYDEEINNLTPREVEAASASVKSKGRTDPFLVVCKCFRVITSSTAILCIAVNVLSAIRSFKERSDELERRREELEAVLIAERDGA
ncbi:hypothetical protein FRX31_022860 [Thalictrum thalictroides]|uniref:Uncharacterized protein n=1 Tax=Thalictrum thalictroides TaxID=46969 RepID=A0A7J6VS18_THATH|nr:hypothetical protein FRX31_022860 [Thalictrum thalictroides]